MRFCRHLAGIVLADSRPPAASASTSPPQPDIARALHNQPTVTTTQDNDGNDVLSATMPGSSGTTIRGTLRLTYPLSEVTACIHRIWGALARACLPAAVALVAFTLARSPAPAHPGSRDHPALRRTARHPPDATTGPPELRSPAASFTHTATRLQQLFKAQQAFASEASHQLKTPLTTLRLRLENLEPRPPIGRVWAIPGALERHRAPSRPTPGGIRPPLVPWPEPPTPMEPAGAEIVVQRGWGFGRGPQRRLRPCAGRPWRSPPRRMVPVEDMGA